MTAAAEVSEGGLKGRMTMRPLSKYFRSTPFVHWGIQTHFRVVRNEGMSEPVRRTVFGASGDNPEEELGDRIRDLGLFHLGALADAP